MTEQWLADARPNEAERSVALDELGVAGTPRGTDFDALCRTAKRLFSVPVAVVVLVTERERWSTAGSGLEDAGTSGDASFCGQTILADDVLVVEDARRDPRFSTDPLVTGPAAIRFYAAAPLILEPGIRIGAICIIDSAPRSFSAEQAAQLADLATIAVAHLRVQGAKRQSEAAADRYRASEALLAEGNLKLYLREQGLQKTNELLSLAEEFAHVGHWRIEIESGIVHSSAGFEKIFGRPAVAGTFHVGDHAVIIHPDDREATLGKMEDLNSGVIDGYENRARIVRPNGETRVIVSRARAERDANGRVRSVFGVCMDITEAADVENQLRQKSALLSSTLDNMNQGLIVIGPDKRLSLINRPALRLLEMPEEWLTANPLLTDVIADRAARGEHLPAHTTETHYGLEAGCHVYERQRPNGSIIEVRTVPLEDGSAIRTFTDVTSRRMAEQALHHSEAQFRLLAESASDMIIRRRNPGQLLYVSPASFEILGYTPAEMTGLSIVDLVHPDDRREPIDLSVEMFAGRKEQGHLTYRLRHRDGRWIWMESSARLVRDADGSPIEIISAVRDISERVAVDKRLRASEERLALALDSGSDGLWDWNVPTDEVWVSGRLWDMLVRRTTGSFEDVMRNAVHPEDQARLRTELEACFAAATKPFQSEFRMMVREGGFIWVMARGRIAECAPDGTPLRMVGTILDITARKEAEDRIAHMARHDALTDLPNRAQFRDQLVQHLAAVERNGGTVAVLCLDLDRFKAVNDTLGHPVGDIVLRKVAQRLRSTIRTQDTVARLGGDEFAILAVGTDSTVLPRMDILSARLLKAVKEPIMVDGQEISVGLTIGIALAPDDGLEADSIFKRADLALYRAKAEGRNTFRFFETGMDEALAERRRLELDLSGALARREFELHYQPVLDMSVGSFSGFEALLRWRHPERGLVSPGHFIPIAEETGLIVPIGDWVLAAACRAAMSWGSPTLTVSVNVSAVQFRHGVVVDSIASALAASGLPASRLQIEITESVLIETDSDVLATVQRIREMGIRVALDDFGTGYSSLSYLHRFPFDRVKIDRRFVTDIDNARTAAIVCATVELARRLGMAVTAEGVETAEQMRLVRAEGCTEVQGYLISRPVPEESARALAGPERAERAERAA